MADQPSLPSGAASRNQPNSPLSLLSGGRRSPDRLDRRVRLYWMFSPRRPQGKRQLCRVLRDRLAGVLDHHRDASRKTCPSTEEMNANQPVDIFIVGAVGGLSLLKSL